MGDLHSHGVGNGGSLGGSIFRFLNGEVLCRSVEASGMVGDMRISGRLGRFRETPVL